MPSNSIDEENRVLINNVDECDIDQDEEQELGVTPLPVRQLAILCLMRATEPISFTVIFPFINQMIEDLKIAPDPTLLWGKLSDRVGRKPILSVGLLGLSLGTTLFGFQKTFIGLIISRSFAGALNGPAIGGYAAKPAEQYPSIELFKRFKIFSDFPYFLPCLIASLLNIFAFFLGFFYLEETLPREMIRNERANYDSTTSTRTSLIIQSNSSPTPGTSSSENASQRQPSETDALLSTNNKKHMGASNQTVKSLMTKPVLRVLLSFSCLSIQNSAWQALVPLFSYTRSVLSLGGLIALCLQTGLFPTLQRKFGTLKLYRIVTLGFPISFLILPLIRIVIIRFIKTEQSYEGGDSIRLVGDRYDEAGRDRKAEVQISMIGLVIDLIFKGIANLSIGTLNGIGQSCASLGRTVGPGLTGFLFSSSVRLKVSVDLVHFTYYWRVWILDYLVGKGYTTRVEEKT
ncbi:major facilitator superfamily domain-containing protein [Phakopsora pachyrhizi]|nr:major facilitator superfamily domain-containing protein [Phakopsora pachyrhizi]